MTKLRDDEIALLVDKDDVYVTVFAMKDNGDGDLSLCDMNQEADFFDVEIRNDRTPSDNCEVLEEYENLSFEQAVEKIGEIEKRFPNISITWEYA
jgi:hypothetical protein